MARTILFLFAVIPASAVAQQSDPFASFHELEPSVVRITVDGTAEGFGKISNHGNGFFVSDQGHILTAFHIVRKNRPNGEEVKWVYDDKGDPQVKIIVERWGDNENLIPGDDKVNYIHGNEAFDLALLRLQGGNYDPVTCNPSLVSLGTTIKGLGWRRDRGAYDPLFGMVVPGENLVGERYRMVGRGFHEDHMGAPLFDDTGKVVAIVTSAQDGSRPPVGEVYATSIDWALDLLPGSAHCKTTALTGESSDNPVTARAVEACVEERVADVRATRVPFEMQDGVRSEGVGGEVAAGNYAEKPIVFTAPEGYEIVEPVRVVPVHKVGFGGFDGPSFDLDDKGRINRVTVVVWSRSPSTLHGFAAESEVRLVGAVAPVVDAEREAEIRSACSTDSAIVADTAGG